MMKLTDFYYDLPQELIAQDPLLKRSESRLMVLDRKDNTIEHKHFYDVIDYLNPGDCLVINDTRVLPARLMGVKEDTGASIEVLLLKRKDDCTWETLVKPGKKCKVGARIVFGSESNEPDPETGLIKGKLVGEVVDIVEEGNRLIRFEFDGIFEEILDELGQMPLPPYITHKLEDKNRYQTVYAEHDGSAAAPTAGLHFTTELLDQIKAKGIKIAHVTLHVGLGTFRPVKEENILDHHMHSEFCIIEQDAADMINETKLQAEGLCPLERQVPELLSLCRTTMEQFMQVANGRIFSFIRDTSSRLLTRSSRISICLSQRFLCLFLRSTTESIYLRRTRWRLRRSTDSSHLAMLC